MLKSNKRDISNLYKDVITFKQLQLVYLLHKKRGGPTKLAWQSFESIIETSVSRSDEIKLLIFSALLGTRPITFQISLSCGIELYSSQKKIFNVRVIIKLNLF